MSRTPCTTKYSALLLTSMLAVVVGSALKSERDAQHPTQGPPPAVANKAGMKSHDPYNEVATAKYDRLDTDNELSWQAHAPQVEPQPDAKFLNHISLPRDKYGYLAENDHRRRPRAGRRLDDVFLKHLIDLLLNELAFSGGNTTWPPMKGAGVTSVESLFHQVGLA